MVRTRANLDSEAMLWSLMPEAEPPARAEDWRLLAAAFHTAVSELSPEERVFLKMRLLHGCTVSEIARAFHFDARSFRRRFKQLLVTLHRLIVAVPSTRH